MLILTENKQRSTGLSVTTNPRTSFSTHGLPEATTAQVLGGTTTGRYVSPLTLQQKLDAGLSFSQITSGVVRERLTLDRDYYVRTDGSNSNTGLSNTAGAAFLTVAYAYAFVCHHIDLNGYNVQIRVQGGTYSEHIYVQQWVGYAGVGFNQLTVIGENGTVTIEGPTAAATLFSTCGSVPTRWKNITWTNPNAAGFLIEADDGGWIVLDACTYGATGAGGIQLVSILPDTRIMLMAGTHTVSGDSGRFGFIRNGAAILNQPATTLALGTGRVYTTALMDVDSGGHNLNTGLTITGSLGSSSVPYVIDYSDGAFIQDVSIYSSVSGAGSASATPLAVGKGGTGQSTEATAAAALIAAFVVGQYPFPATQNPSAGANTLDDYEEGDWTPVLTFATPGDLSVSYTTQLGRYTKIGRVVFIQWTITTSAFTHTTASGQCLITTLPFTPAGLNCGCALGWQGVTKANYTDLLAQISSGSTSIGITASGSAVALAVVAATDMPTGGTVIIRGEGFFTV